MRCHSHDNGLYFLRVLRAFFRGFCALKLIVITYSLSSMNLVIDFVFIIQHTIPKPISNSPTLIAFEIQL